MKRFAILLALLSSGSVALANDFLTEPNRHMTPGAVRDLTITKICRTTWGSDARAVTQGMKDRVVEAYQFDVATCPITVIKGKRVRRFEIDHLIPRSIGGADEEANLWPQCYEPVNKDKSKQADGANKKDRLEKKLNQLVCHPRSAELLEEYQEKIRRDWKALYHEIYPEEDE